MSVVDTVVTPARSSAGPPPTTARSGAVRTSLDRRGVRITLGMLWLLDGLLQLQPAMVTTRFARQVVAPAAAGQPGWVAWPVLHAAKLVSAHALASDLGFALVQLALGVFLLVPRTARPALAASVVWAAGVWAVGEGFGGIAGGTASVLTGAPGAALLYGILAIAAWPAGRAGTGPLPSGPVRPWFAGAWATLWVALGMSALLPANRSAGRVADQLTQVAGSVPAWLAHFDVVTAAVARHTGWAGVTVLVMLPMAVGVAGLGRGPVLRLAAWSGIVVAAVTWVVGESFGQLGSGLATDPNTGPLLFVAALALLGTADRRRMQGAPTGADPAVDPGSGHRSAGVAHR